MNNPVVGIVSPGEMGGAVGRALAASGITVLTCIAGRSSESSARAKEAGFATRDNIAAIVESCDIFLSIVPPAAAESTARAFADAARHTHRRMIFIECNAISPERARRIAELFGETNVTFLDGGIIGAPPGEVRPRLYISGDATDATKADIARMLAPAFEVRDLGARIGQASGMKMVYAAITKGINALIVASFLAAERMELLDDLAAEFAQSQPALSARAMSYIPRLPADAGR